jgi:hypothetical protein
MLPPQKAVQGGDEAQIVSEPGEVFWQCVSTRLGCVTYTYTCDPYSVPHRGATLSRLGRLILVCSTLSMLVIVVIVGRKIIEMRGEGINSCP